MSGDRSVMLACILTPFTPSRLRQSLQAGTPGPLKTAAHCFAVAASNAPALPLLSPIFGDHMVLQRGKTNTIWGWAQPGQLVEISIAGHATSGTASPAGRWRLRPRSQRRIGFSIKRWAAIPNAVPQTTMIATASHGGAWTISASRSQKLFVGKCQR